MQPTKPWSPRPGPQVPRLGVHVTGPGRPVSIEHCRQRLPRCFALPQFEQCSSQAEIAARFVRANANHLAPGMGGVGKTPLALANLGEKGVALRFLGAGGMGVEA